MEGLLNSSSSRWDFKISTRIREAKAVVIRAETEDKEEVKEEDREEEKVSAEGIPSEEDRMK